MQEAIPNPCPGARTEQSLEGRQNAASTAGTEVRSPHKQMQKKQLIDHTILSVPGRHECSVARRAQRRRHRPTSGAFTVCHSQRCSLHWNPIGRPHRPHARVASADRTDPKARENGNGEGMRTTSPVNAGTGQDETPGTRPPTADAVRTPGSECVGVGRQKSGRLERAICRQCPNIGAMPRLTIRENAGELCQHRQRPTDVGCSSGVSGWFTQRTA